MDYIANIRSVWLDCTPKDHEFGMDWYAYARTIAEQLHPNLLVGAGVLAALSPMTEWTENIRRARVAIDSNGSHIQHTAAMASKVRSILALNDPNVEDIAEILHGLKISNFFRNIIGDWQSVTIDRHAMAIAGFEGNITPKRYEMLSNAYKDFANEVGLDPAIVQAITWVRWKSTNTLMKNQAYSHSK